MKKCFSLISVILTVALVFSACLCTVIAAEVKGADFSIANINLYAGYSEKITYTSGSPDGAEYFCDNSEISFSDGRVYASDSVQPGTYIASASRNGASVSFSVTIGDPLFLQGLRGNTEFSDRLYGVENGVKSFGCDEGKLTLFAGDSFMDDRVFFSDFYSRFAGKNAYTVGINSSRATHWYWWAQKTIIPLYPESLVLHIGTNDIFDGGADAAIAADSVISLFNELHEGLPDTQIYWWTIELRTAQSDAAGNAVSKETNALVKAFADNNPWVKILDSRSQFSNEDDTPKLNLYRDTVHVKCPSSYDILMKLAYDAGLKITDNHTIGESIPDWNTGYMDNFGNSRVVAGANSAFIFETNVTINRYSDNAHITLNLNNSVYERFLVWNNANDGHFKFGKAYHGNYSTGDEFIDGSTSPTFKLTVCITGGKAYMLIDDRTKVVFENPPQVDFFTVGTESGCFSFTNTRVIRYTRDIDGWSTRQDEGLAANAKDFQQSTKRFVWGSDITIDSVGNNAHISLAFNNDMNNRFLIWNSQNDGKFYYTGCRDGNYQATSDNYLDISGKNTIRAEVMVLSDKAYLVVDGNIVTSFDNPPEINYLNVGSQDCSASFANVRNCALSTGDANDDGKVNTCDALLVLQHAVSTIKLDAAHIEVCDVDGKKDGLASSDALTLLQYSVKKIDSISN